MTNEEAIKVINGHIKNSCIAYGTFTRQALHMAIEALKAQLSQENTTSLICSIADTISRQAAKEAYCKHFCHLYCYRDTLCSDNLCKEVNEAFDKLPPAQPEMIQWILCSERLPERTSVWKTEYLVTVKCV